MLDFPFQIINCYIRLLPCYVFYFYDKSVALNVGCTLSNLTGNAIEGSGSVLIWDNVPVIFLEELRKISGKIIHYS